MNRREIAEETVRLVDRRAYPGIDEAIAGTRLHEAEEVLPVSGEHNDRPRIEVTFESTLAAARRLGEGSASLVFASARNPGGGFLRGAVAQEEDVARSSALYACQLTKPEFYQSHRRSGDLRYSHRVIYSPSVPVFRNDRGSLLDDPFTTSMLTAAAPNLGAIDDPRMAATVPAVLRERAARVLAVAAYHGHRVLVLGAWGCGVFRNNPPTVADAFADALKALPLFDHVVFAVRDRVPGTPVYHAFARTFGV